MIVIDNDPFAAWSFEGNRFVQALASATGLPPLAAHLHEIILFTAIYSVVYVVSSVVSPMLIPEYRRLTHRNRINFDMHVVSHIQSLFLCSASFPLFFSPALSDLGSYTPYAGFVCATAVGYFVWDTYVSIKYMKLFGAGFVAHAVAAMLTFTLALKPFMLNFAAPFMWFEASTPFVNVHWFATHVPGLVSEKTKTINGLCLLVVFFLCRIVAGPINAYRLFSEALRSPPAHVPHWAVYSALTCYSTLSLLNFVWFGKMVQMAHRALQSNTKRE